MDEQELLDKLDELEDAIRKLRERIAQRDDSNEDLNNEDRKSREDGDESTEDELMDKLDELIEEYENAERSLKKVQARNARLSGIQTRRQERAERTDRVGSPTMPHTDARNTRNGRHEYSLMRAIRGQTNAILGHGSGLSGLELEVHQELSRVRGKPGSGVLVPWDASIPGIQRRDLSTLTGQGAVPLNTIATMIDVLRAKLVMVSLGANLITDQTQPFALPKTTATVTGTHVQTEGTSPAKQNPTIDDLQFGYKSIEASTKLTRQFINGSSVSAEAYIVNQLTKAVATALENACLNGAGANGVPKGIFKMTNGGDGIGVKEGGANGKKLTWADHVEMTGMVNTANAPDGNLGWLFSPAYAAFLEAEPKVSGHPVFILGDAGTVNGYPVGRTSLALDNLTKGTAANKCSAIAFGAWDEALIALFTGIDLFIDPFSAQPHVNVTVAQDYDFHLAHAEAFAICVDALRS